MNKFVAIALLLMLVAGAIAWLVDRGGVFPSKHISYRFEVTVRTPSGPMTAHSVHNLVIKDTTMTPARNYQIELDGEAVAFALPDGRYLFATLRTEDGMGFVELFGTTVGFSGTGKWSDAPDRFDNQVSPLHFPKLALIDDPDDRETLRLIDGQSAFEVLGAKLVSTDEKMTEEVRRILPWLVPTIHDRPKPPVRIPEINVLASYLKVGVL